MTAGPTVAPGLGGLEDVQRLVLKGFPATAALHIGLTVRDAARARAFLGDIAADGGPRAVVTTAADWDRKTGVCLTVGITFAGLRALGVPEEELASFPAEFRAGAAARAAVVGDEGPSRPGAWLPWLRGATGGELHLLLTLLGSDRTEVDDVAEDLAQWWGRDLHEIGRFEAAALAAPGAGSGGGSPGGSDGSAPERGLLVHFGYRDGLSQPTVEGLPLVGLRDPLEPVPVGALVLGHEVPGMDRRGLAYSYPVPGSSALGHHGSFAAFRILEQDVHAFEQYLQDQAGATKTSAGLIAAKLCGRWRDGSPLVLRPSETSPELPLDDYNDFDYLPDEHGNGVDDRLGERCPVGAHIRRMNPRRAPVAGAPTVSRHRRLVRRGMPYGPAYEPGQPRDHVPRGLVGLFIGASLRDSYEFLMQEWANDGAFSADLGRTQDPLLGAHDRAGTDTFAVPGVQEGPLKGLPRFVTTRGGAYLFLPSTTALRSLADGSPDNPAAARRFVDLLAAASRPNGARRAVGRRVDDPSWALLLTWFTTRRGALLRQLLEDGPFLRTPAAVIVSGYQDVLEVLERPDVFAVEPYASDMRAINEGKLFVLGMDAGPDVQRDGRLLRRAVPDSVAEDTRTQVRAEAPALLSVPGQVDVVRFATALTVRVAVERFGLRGLGPDTLADRCHEVFVGLFANLNEDLEVTARAARARAFLRDHIDGLVSSPSFGASSSVDVLRRLVEQAPGNDVAHQLIGLVVGLVDNAIAGICSAVDELLARPEVLTRAQRAAGQPADLLDRIVWEVLRFSPPAPLLTREATRSWTFSSNRARTVSQGQLVLAVTAGAMLDPSGFPDPESVEDDRPVDRYLHFGAGIHRCLGEQLGRAVVVEAVRALLLSGVSCAPGAGLERRGDRPVRFPVELSGVR